VNYDVVVNFGCSFMNGDRVRYINDNGQETNLGEKIVAAKLLSDKLKCDFVNLAKTGAANDTIFRRLYSWVESNTIYKNPLIIIGLSGTARFSYFSEHQNRFYNLHPHQIDSYDDKSLEVMNERVTNNLEKPSILRSWLEYYCKWFYSDEHNDKKLQQEITFLHYYLKGNNCDYRLHNSLQDSLGSIKSKINYVSFQDEYYQDEDCWYKYLRWQMKEIDKEEFNDRERFRSPFPPYGKRFCEGHPSPNANKELFERIYEDLK
tara:strand:- start:34 stop:819 length:786 start_codon:yes stop_codon:yes gene_type:complete